MESIYMSICNRKLTNRGFVKGPLCPIYGIGALSVYFILRPWSENYVVLYFAGAILATVFEYLVAIIMKRMFGKIWWDYSNKPFNFQGILCLESTIAWGFYTVLLFAFLHKFVVRFVHIYEMSTGIIMGCTVIFAFIIDLGVTVVRNSRQGEKVEEIV